MAGRKCAVRRLREAGFKVADPPEVIALRKLQRDEQDPLREFIAECTVPDPKGRIEVGDVRQFYENGATGADNTRSASVL